MKLDHEFVRKLLINFEKCTDINGISEQSLKKVADDCGKNWDELCYTLEKLKEADFITTRILYGSNVPVFIQKGNLTYNGHEFLDTIRDPKIWKKTKEIAHNFQSISLSELSKIGATVLADAVKHFLQY